MTNTKSTYTITDLQTDLIHCIQLASQANGADKRAMDSRKMADNIVREAYILGGGSVYVSSLRETFAQLDRAGAFEATPAQIETGIRKKKELAILKAKAEKTGLKRSALVVMQSELDAMCLSVEDIDKLKANIKKSNKQTAFRVQRNALAAYSMAENDGVQRMELESDKYNFRLVAFTAEVAVKQTPLEKWLEKGQDFLSSRQLTLLERMVADNEIVVQYEHEQAELIARKESEQVQAIIEKVTVDYRARALELLANIGQVEPSEEIVSLTIESVKQMANV